MKKIVTFVLSTLILSVYVLPSFALHGFSAEELNYKGFSPYMVELVELQESRHEDEQIFESPTKFKTFWWNVVRGDILVPTQKFGYYNTSERF